MQIAVKDRFHKAEKELGSVVSEPENDLSHKFVGQFESILKNLLKPLVWRPFPDNDIFLLTDIPSKI